MVKKLNRDQKLAKNAGLLAVFVQRYARKARPAKDPNDRRYDRNVEVAVKRMPPDEFDRLLHDDETIDVVHNS